MTIVVRALTELDEMYEAVELQKTYWGTEVESLVPGQMLFTIAQSGGHVFAAIDDGRMVGMLVGLLGADGFPARDHLRIFSKRMVVLPEYRGQGIAQDLKFAQREAAMRQGVRLITWTYDPLLSVNAHFNIRKLGCVVYDYVVNYYGTAGDAFGLSLLGASDRFVATWIADAPDVVARAQNRFSGRTYADYVQAGAEVLNPARSEAGVLYPVSDVSSADAPLLLLEIPTEFRAIANATPELARAWREHTRTIFVSLMNERGYFVADFVRGDESAAGRVFYVLRQREGSSDQPRLGE